MIRLTVAFCLFLTSCAVPTQVTRLDASSCEALAHAAIEAQSVGDRGAAATFGMIAANNCGEVR